MNRMQKLQEQGAYRITLVDADCRFSIGFWEGILGTFFMFEQPNFDVPEESHLCFDPGDGRLMTVFANENWHGPLGPKTWSPRTPH
jgi:glyoxalase family protein